LPSEAGDPDAALLQELPELERHVAALGDEADRARGHGRGGQLEALRRVGDAEAVRPEQHGARRADAVHDGGLPRGPLLPQLGEPGGDGDDGLGAGGQRVVHRGLEAGGRHGEDHEVDGLADVRNKAMGRLSEHALATAVDQVDRAHVARGERLRADPVPVLRRIVARADHGDRTRREQRRQIARAGSG
jgi:hypothetical protein